MARARNIKPGFFHNEELVELPFATRLLFIGLWTLADREGRLEDRPKRIKMALFAADDINVDNSLSELSQSNFIVRYEVDGERYIQIEQFVKHQNPHHMEAPSAIPPMDGKENKFNHTPISPKQRARIYQRDGQKCVICSAKENLQIDHIKLVSNGGTSEDDNLRTLCAQCNNKRSKKGEPEANRADSLIPDSFNLIPDSLIPDVLIPNSPQQQPLAPAIAVAAKKTKAEKSEPNPLNLSTWQSYREAYTQRYSVPPVRDAATNAKIKAFVASLGADAPAVAEFYVWHSGGRYVSGMHQVGMMAMDCAKLRTEWATNSRMTQAKAQMADRTATNHDAFAPLIAAAKAREEEERNRNANP